MNRLQAYKYELKPNCDQQCNMRRFVGAFQLLFNKALAMQKAGYEQDDKKLGYAGLCRSLTEWKGQVETVWQGREYGLEPLENRSDPLVVVSEMHDFRVRLNNQAHFACVDCGFEENDRSGRRNQYLNGRACRVSLWRNGAVGPPSEAVTHRSDYTGVCPCLAP